MDGLPTMRDVVRCTAAVCGVTREALLGRRRYLRIARPRQIAMYLSRVLLGHSYPEIGRFFGVDHTSALHAHRNITTRMDDGDERLRKNVEAVREALTEKKEPQPYLPSPRADLIRQIRDAIALATEKLAELEASP